MVAKRPHKPIIPKGQLSAARQGEPNKGGHSSQAAPSNGVHKHRKTPPAAAAPQGSAPHGKRPPVNHQPAGGFVSSKGAAHSSKGNGHAHTHPAAAAAGGTGGSASFGKGGAGHAAGAPRHPAGANKQQYQHQRQPGKPSQHNPAHAPPRRVPAAAAAAAGPVTATGPDGQPLKKKKWHPKKRPRVVDPADDAPAAVAAAATTAKAQGAPKKKHKKSKPKAVGVPGVTTSTALPEPGADVMVGSNWLALKKVITASGGHAKRRPAAAAVKKLPSSVGNNSGPTQVVAMDCEMVGVGPYGKRSALARVCVVNNDGNVLLDTFVCPKEAVTDYRTKYSGVRAEDLASPQAITMLEAQMRVADLMKGRIVVGHALHNDMKALMLAHPVKDIRDTAKYPPLMLSTAPGRKPTARALRHLALEVLGLSIQAGEHSPVDDARCALYLYHRHRKAWEDALRSGKLARTVQAMGKKRAPKVDILKRDLSDDPLADL